MTDQITVFLFSCVREKKDLFFHCQNPQLPAIRIFLYLIAMVLLQTARCFETRDIVASISKPRLCHLKNCTNKHCRFLHLPFQTYIYLDIKTVSSSCITGASSLRKKGIQMMNCFRYKCGL